MSDMDDVGRLVSDATAAIDALRELVDGTDPDVDGAALAAYQRLGDELADLYVRAANAMGRHSFDENDDLDVAGGRVHRSWRAAGQTHWHWDLAKPAIVAHLVEKTSKDLKPLIVVVVDEVEDLVGLTKSKAGRVGEFKKRRIWSEMFRTQTAPGGRWHYKFEEESDGDRV